MKTQKGSSDISYHVFVFFSAYLHYAIKCENIILPLRMLNPLIF